MISIRIFDTPVNIKPVVLVNLIVLWGFAAWFGLYQHPNRNLGMGLLDGFMFMIVLIIADFGHAIAHIFSARYAKAPMDEILIAAGMPRTLYTDNNVSPAAHRMRAIGGPVFSTLGLLLSIVIYSITANNSVIREIVAWSIAGHSFILLGCLLPLPILDGGTILKWTLVEKGRTEPESDQILKQVNWFLGGIVGVIGAVLMVAQMWIAGLIFIGVGGIAIAAAVGKIR